MSSVASLPDISRSDWEGLPDDLTNNVFSGDLVGDGGFDALSIFPYHDFLDSLDVFEDAAIDGYGLDQLTRPNLPPPGFGLNENSEVVSGVCTASVAGRDASVCRSAPNEHPKRRRAKFGPQQLRRLRDWIVTNLNTPYLMEKDVEELATSTELSAKQVRTYLNNYRKRKLTPIAPGPATATDPAWNSKKLETVSGIADKACIENVLESRAMPLQSVGQHNDMRKRYYVGDPAPSKDETIDSLHPVPTSVCSNHRSDADRKSLDEIVGTRSLEAATFELLNKFGTDSPEDRPFAFRFYQGSFLDWYFESLITPAASAKNCHSAVVKDQLEVCDCKDGNHLALQKRFSNDVMYRGTGLETTVSHRYPPDFNWLDSDISVDVLHNEDKTYRREDGSCAGSLAGSANSGESCASNISRASFGARKGRRAHGDGSRKINSEGDFSCDLCASKFTTKYSRDRHTTSIHKPNKYWICSPLLADGPDIRCPICEADPSGCPHKMPACWVQPERERTFYRKDGLVQHLRLVHRMDNGTCGERLKLLEQTPKPPATLAPPPPREAIMTLKPLDHVMQICWHEFVLHRLRGLKSLPPDKRIKDFQDCWHQAVAQASEPFYVPTVHISYSYQLPHYHVGATFVVTIRAGGIRKLAEQGHTYKCTRSLLVHSGHLSLEAERGSQRATCILLLSLFLIVMAGNYPQYLEEINVLSGDWDLHFRWLIPNPGDTIDPTVGCTSACQQISLWQTWPWIESNAFSCLDKWS